MRILVVAHADMAEPVDHALIVEDAIARDQILDLVWGYTFDSDTNSLAVYIGYLRRKLEEAGEDRLIHTVRGVGYALRTA